MLQLNTETRAVDSLTAVEIDGMYALYQKYYDGTCAERFQQDLCQKHYVVELRDTDSKLRGFSTLALLDYQFKGQRQRAIYSGDTVIHDAYWGSQALPLAWAQLAGTIKAETPAVPLYWLLIVKGHRTYRYLTLFANEYFPSRLHETPATVQSLMDFLAEKQFGDAYNHEQGVVRYANSHGHLKKDWAVTPQHLLQKPNVRFFLERNPGFANGDELVCLTELRADNLRSHVLREFSNASQHV